MARKNSPEKPKQKHRKGLWSPDEDLKLKTHVLKNGHACWTSVPINAGLQRNGKSCRLRWINYLRPGLKRGVFSTDEEELILSLHAMLGNKWSQIAQHLQGRTDNEVKNHWHSYLKKRVAKTEQTEKAQAKIAETSLSNNLEASPSSSIKSFSTSNSFERLEGSLMSDSTEEQSTKSNLPKVLFAEWFSLERFCDQNNRENSSNMTLIDNRHPEFFNSEFQEAFMDDLLQPPSLKFEDQMFGHGFVGFGNDGMFL